MTTYATTHDTDTDPGYMVIPSHLLDTIGDGEIRFPTRDTDPTSAIAHVREWCERMNHPARVDTITYGPDGRVVVIGYTEETDE